VYEYDNMVYTDNARLG